MKAVGYHGTNSKYRDSIEKNGLDPRKSTHRSDHWLGQGVYFFDDYRKAQWWASTLLLKKRECSRLVYKSVIEAPEEEVLDLDDNAQLDYFMTQTLKTVKEIEKERPGPMPVFDDKKFRAVFFDYFKEKNGMAVMMGTFTKSAAGYMAKRSRDELKRQKAIMDTIGLGYKEKQICVSRKECIKSADLVYDEEEVV
ncbi:MAG: hypothetical protein HFH54_05070 [Lachnospiraceae bacterium]|nr:hypothetical protein [Lachnospiraceae bacterium]